MSTATTPLSPQEYKRRKAERERMRRKRKRQRRLRILLVTVPPVLLLGLLVLLAGACWRMLKVQQYTVTGAERYTAEEIWEASGVTLGENMLHISPEEVQSAVTKKLPYVESVDFSRSFPYKIGFRVTEVSEVLSAVCGKQAMLLDRRGKVLERLQKKPKEVFLYLPACEETQPGEVLRFPRDAYGVDPLAALDGILEATESCEIRDGITQIDLRSAADVTLQYQDLITLRLGTRTDYGNRLQRAKSVLAEMEKNNDLQKGSMDLTLEGPTPFRPYTPEETVTAPEGAAPPGQDSETGDSGSGNGMPE